MELLNLTSEWFTPAKMESDPAAPAFQLRPLNGLEFTRLVGGAVAVLDAERRIKGYEMSGGDAGEILSRCLTGWRNITRDGKPVPFSDDEIRNLPPAVVSALVDRVIQMSTLTPEAKKNSSTPSP